MTDDEPDATPEGPKARTRLQRRGRRIAAAAADVAEPVVGAVSSVLDSAAGLAELPARGVRRVRRGPAPLPSLADLHPEARFAAPVEVGLRTIDVDDIRGTAVGGGDQRGTDFQPLPVARTANWDARWQRLRRANERLELFPPIDVVKYAGAYWVIDGHNRVALALAAGQVGIDASIVELVPPNGRRTEPILSLAASAEAFRPVRTRAGIGADSADIVEATVDGATAPPEGGPGTAG